MNTFYHFNNPVSPGTTIRSDKYNFEQSSITVGFDKVQIELANKLDLPDGVDGQLPEFNETDSLIGISGNGDLYYYKVTQLHERLSDIELDAQSRLKAPSGINVNFPAKPAFDSLVSINSAGEFYYYSMAAFNQTVSYVENWRNETEVFKNNAATSAANALASELATQGYSLNAGVPLIIPDGGSYTVSDNTFFLEIVCLGDATITLPANPKDKSKFVINAFAEQGAVEVKTSGGTNLHQIDKNDGNVDTSALVTGIYQLNLYWLGAGIYRGM